MNDQLIQGGEIRSDYLHPSRYTSREFALLENKYLWTQVWQWACRLEEIQNPGDYVVYDVVDQSIIVIRTTRDEVKAFHNVCPHRGRRLLSGQGHITKFHCMFHAWQWSLDGVPIRILDHEQWENCSGMCTEDLKLSEVSTAEWAGFVFICMADKPEPFEEFIFPAPQALAPLAMEKMHYAWHLIIDVESNWKVAQEAFMESYHVWGTHPQFLQFIDEKNKSEARGKHGMHYYLNELPPGVPSRRIKETDLSVDEVRKGFSAFVGALAQQVGNLNWDGQLTRRSVNAAQGVLQDIPSGTAVADFINAAIVAMKDAAEEDGAYFPMLTENQISALGSDWNIFPTLGIVPSFDGTLIFRALPRENDPNKCTIEMISLLHWGKDKEPKIEKKILNDWKKQHHNVVPPLLLQDLINMEDVQKGMHSLGLKGLRLNPVQEVQIFNFHRVINQYIHRDKNSIN